jgi:hypothetical protein
MGSSESLEAVELGVRMGVDEFEWLEKHVGIAPAIV